MSEWTTDEFGNKTWKFQGWTIWVWPGHGTDCTGPDHENLDFYPEDQTVRIEHQVGYDGNVSVTVPALVLTEFIRVSQGPPKVRKTIEMQLTEAFASHGVVVRPFKSSLYDQDYWGASDRIKGFYARRNYPDRGGYHPPAPYDISNRHPWPTKAQMADPDFVTGLVTACIAELDAHKSKREVAP